MTGGNGATRVGGELTPREQQVLELLSRGLTNMAMADQLDVTVHSIKFHLASIYRKLGVSNRTQAAAAYLRTVSATGRLADLEGAMR